MSYRIPVGHFENHLIQGGIKARVEGLPLKDVPPKITRRISCVDFQHETWSYEAMHRLAKDTPATFVLWSSEGEASGSTRNAWRAW